jgi:hypothetical protein
VRPGTCPTCQSWVSEQQTPSYRLRRADEQGSDARHYGWDKTEFFYAQTGMLARADLVRAVDLLAEGNKDAVLDLLTPLEDEPELLASARQQVRADAGHDNTAGRVSDQ